MLTSLRVSDNWIIKNIKRVTVKINDKIDDALPRRTK